MWFLAPCGHVRDRLSALDEGDVGHFERLQLRVHLAMCRACGSVQRGLRETRDALETLRDDTA